MWTTASWASSSTSVKNERPAAPRGTGLCALCRHLRIVDSGKGSRFVLCERSRTDEEFPRYPHLPVFQCTGFEALLPPQEEP